MARLEELQPDTSIRGVLPNELVTVEKVKWHGSEVLELIFKDSRGQLGQRIFYRDDEAELAIVEAGRPWSLDGDGRLFRLASEAHRIQLAHLFDPLLAVHTSDVEPLPHQITAVYEEMLPRQPLRFLLADDPGAGKTIMAGLLIKELIVRGDLHRCLVVCPGGLAEQWQDELYRRFQLPFDIMTNDKLKTARTGNWFVENNLVIARLDKLSRNEDLQAKLDVPDAHWDLVVCDEAHKMSASFFGREIKYTKRYRLGQRLSSLTRHFLLLTATPHNGKEADFQLFMALIDSDRFEGRFRDGVHTRDVSDLMRRMVKENLLKFDTRPLFPPRVAKTVSYRLSDKEKELYKAVTAYVREEFNRADALLNDKRARTVGFALTILQRRLASSPEAIYRSLYRRRERLESRLRELEHPQRDATVQLLSGSGPSFDAEYLDDLEEAPVQELEDTEDQILGQATAARTLAELKAEIATLVGIEKLAVDVRNSCEDKKWLELAELLKEIFASATTIEQSAEDVTSYGADVQVPKVSPNQKLIIFTEHRDTLTYLVNRVSTLLGQEDAVVIIHGSVGREDRIKVQEAFKHDPQVKVLVATDAAGEGINLQRAHLMVNYDLPWNPNRLEQRFGRIHRIGQTEVCFVWNLVAAETREGDVYRTLLEKLERAREALGGKVFDVLGKIAFDGKSLRELLIEAVRSEENSTLREHFAKTVEGAFDIEKLRSLLEDSVLVPESMNANHVHRVREEMERADARRLQPHYIESFFLEAFGELGGTVRQREPRRYEVSHVPASVRNRDRLIGREEPVLFQYERVAFEKSRIALPGQPLAAFVCPGHPLLDATLDLTLERHRDLMRCGAVLVDERDFSENPRMLFYLEHAIQDGSQTRSGDRRIVSKRILYVEMDANKNAYHPSYAPYLDYRPLREDEPTASEVLQCPECSWLSCDLEGRAQEHAILKVVPAHLKEVSGQRLKLIEKTEDAVKERLTKEITYWHHRAEELKLQEQVGKVNARLNSNQARRRADELQGRLRKRLDELHLEAKLSPLPPIVIGCALVVPVGLLAKIAPDHVAVPAFSSDTQTAADRARQLVLEVERDLGYEPQDRELEKLGYDIESRVPGTGRLRFIEVKGRVEGASTITVTKNEVLYSLNKPDDFILAIVEFKGDLHTGNHQVRYVRRPFQREPDFGVTSVNYDFAELLARAEPPR